MTNLVKLVNKPYLESKFSYSFSLSQFLTHFYQFRLGFCFLDNVQDPQNPSENCYEDVQWNKSVGKFYSKEACFDYVAVEPPPSDYYDSDYVAVADDPIPPPPPDVTFDEQ